MKTNEVFAVVDSISGDFTNLFNDFEGAKKFFFNVTEFDLKNDYEFYLLAVPMDQNFELDWDLSREILSGKVFQGQIFFSQNP